MRAILLSIAVLPAILLAQAPPPQPPQVVPPGQDVRSLPFPHGGYLGIGISEITSERAKALKLKAQGKALYDDAWKEFAARGGMDLFRGTMAGREGSNTAGGLFYSPDRSVAEAYAGKDGTVSVTVRGKMTGIWPLTISETVTGPIECFRTQASQGTACG